MKFAIVISYREQQRETIRALAREHHDYLAGFLASGHVFAMGPVVDDQGALWVMEADSAERIEEIVRGDPYNQAGVFGAWQIQRLAYWSAKAHKGL